MSTASLKEFSDSINYAIFFIAACKHKDEFNTKQTREHLFRLRKLVELINGEREELNNLSHPEFNRQQEQSNGKN